MKKTFQCILILLISAIVISCEDSVDPKAEFREEYVLNCIINLDTNYQVATISRTFDVSGYDPYTNTIDPFISDAVVKIYYDNLVYTMKDTSMPRQDTSRYKTPMHFYYLNNFKPNTSRPIEVEAELSNGSVLTGNAQVYSLSGLYLSSSIAGTTIDPSLITNEVNFLEFVWGDYYSKPLKADVNYSPELVILYSYESNGIIEKLEKKVARIIVHGDRDAYPIYPEANTKDNSMTFSYEAFEKAMTELSDGDPHKENYKIEGVLFRLLIMDKNLAAYYSAQKTFLDEFSVRVNQPDFSNVQSGLGLVGSYSIKKMKFKIKSDYILSFGYKY